MKYMGSKARHAKELLAIILKDRKRGQWYVEPFVGGGNTFHLVDGNKAANDSNMYVVALLEAVGNGWIPPEVVTEDGYRHAREHRFDMPKYEVGFVAIGASYSGKWFGGYARGNDNKGKPRNYALESRNNILKQASGLKGVYSSGDYHDMPIPPNSIIYCDPPYADTTKYDTGFDTNEFWGWCNSKVLEGHQVFVSEYSAPDGWICVWEKAVNSSLTKQTGSKKATEKLWTIK
jgi:DNA adenine methylase